jgi:hypothetical protein
MKSQLILLYLCFLVHFQSWSITRYVATTGTDAGDCSVGNCQTITYTILQAVDGDVIEVAAGTYHESIVINKSLTLIGAKVGIHATGVGRGTGESIIFRPASNLTTGVLITIQNANVVIDGFTLNGNSEYVQGIFINGVGNVTIQNNIIRKFNTTNTNPATQLEPAGIYGTGTATGNVIQNNLIENIRNPTYTISSFAIPDPANFVTGAGIRVRNNFNATISQNVMDSTSIGIEVRNYSVVGSGGIVSNNQINGLNNVPIYQGITLVNLTNGSWTVSNNDLAFSQAFFTVSFFGFPQNIPNSGINLAQISTPITIQDNDISGSFYGFYLYDIANTANLSIQNGNITQVTQGIACTNQGTAYASSTFSLDGVVIQNFPNTFPAISGLLTTLQFQAGVYLIAASGSNNEMITTNIQNCTIQGTVINTYSPSAGIYAYNAHASNYLINLTVSDSDISNHANRGIHFHRINNSSFTRCDINNNGFNGFFNGSFVDGLGIYFRQLCTNITFSECNLNNNTGATASIRLENNSVCAINRCSVVGTLLIQNLESQTIDASGCWWGNTTPPTAFSATTNIDFTPWLNVATDTDGATRGFQGDFSYLNIGANSGEGTQLGGIGRIQEAHNLAIEGATLYIRDMIATYLEIVVVNKNLTFANPSIATIQELRMNGSGKTLTLANDFQISNDLNMLDGIIETGTNILWVINNDVNAVSSSTTSWVNGYLRRNINIGASNFYGFPVGRSANAEKAEIQLNNTSGGLSYLTIRFVAENPFSYPTPTTYTLTPFTESATLYNDLLTTGYWEITPNGVASSTDYDLHLYPSFDPAISAIVKRVLPATVWQQDGSPLTVTGGVGRQNLSGFSNFALAVPNVPLSAYLNRFEAIKQGENTVQVLWSVPLIAETEYFELQRSFDSKTFETKAIINHTDFSYQYIDVLPNTMLSEWVYYRLLCYHPSNKEQYNISNTISVRFPQNDTEWSVFPNPANDFVFIHTQLDKNALIFVINAHGEVLCKQDIQNSLTKLNLKDLCSGTYILKIIDLDQITYKKLIIR